MSDHGWIGRDQDFEDDVFAGVEKGLCGCRREVPECDCFAGYHAGLRMCYCLRDGCVCTEVGFTADE
jgi:hypothetical protein